jgi:small subunit ribosomal protein S11
MSEDKKDLKVANNAEEIKKASSPVAPQTEINNSVDLDSGDEGVDSILGKGEAGEELPEEIKKKLESRKEEKTNKKVFKKKKKRAKVKVDTGKVYVKASYNNTIVTVTDFSGNVLSWASAGMAGFKGPKKATSYAAQIIAKIALLKAKEDYGLKEAAVYINGIGTGREAAVRAVNANGISITAIRDITPIPHNGCRPKKPRRV